MSTLIFIRRRLFLPFLWFLSHHTVRSITKEENGHWANWVSIGGESVYEYLEAEVGLIHRSSAMCRPANVWAFSSRFCGKEFTYNIARPTVQTLQSLNASLCRKITYIKNEAWEFEALSGWFYNSLSHKQIYVKPFSSSCLNHFQDFLIFFTFYQNLAAKNSRTTIAKMGQPPLAEQCGCVVEMVHIT